MESIDEAIADAKAEEEVNQANIKDFRDQLREKLAETFVPTPIPQQTISIDLEEYVQLRQRALELDRLIAEIEDNLMLAYGCDALYLKDNQKVLATYKTFYPDAYAFILERLKETDGDK